LGSYDFVAEALFRELDVGGFFLEYDEEWAGSFEPLRFVPGRWSCWGWSRPRWRTGRPQAADRRGSRFLRLDQLRLSGQCGFSSVVEGSALSSDEEVAKLERAQPDAWRRATPAHRQGHPGRLGLSRLGLPRTPVPAHQRDSKSVIGSAECASVTASQTPHRRCVISGQRDQVNGGYYDGHVIKVL
jgi:hypothetical protein